MAILALVRNVLSVPRDDGKVRHEHDAVLGDVVQGVGDGWRRQAGVSATLGHREEMKRRGRHGGGGR